MWGSGDFRSDDEIYLLHMCRVERDHKKMNVNMNMNVNLNMRMNLNVNVKMTVNTKVNVHSQIPYET